MPISTQILDAILSEYQLDFNYGSFIPTCREIEKSTEFTRLLRKATCFAVNEGAAGDVKSMEGAMEAALKVAILIGYRAKEAEIGAAELAAMFTPTPPPPQP